jgi:hypothetical protein
MYIIHLAEGSKGVSENRLKYLGQQSQETHGSAVIDQIGFYATNLDEMIHHLEEKDIDFKERQVSDAGAYQLFFFDPNGIKIELNFPNSETNGRVPQLRASSLTMNS